MAAQVPPGALGTTPAATPAKPPPDKDQSLAFKVMRLCRPSFHQYQPVAAEPDDVLGDLGGVGSETDGRAGDGFGLTGMLTLPPNFGNIFMGENFSSYISAFNQTDSTVSSVGVKAELQTKTKRLTLLDTTDEPLLSFAGGENRDFIVESPLRELGTHILVCSAQYVNAAGEKRAFRQFFKFQVQPAFVVKHEARPIAHGASAGALLLEVSVQSCLPGPAFLEDVKFREAPAFSHAEWSGKAAAQGSDADTAGSFLAPSDVRQYLYTLEPGTVLPLPLAEPVLVGQFDMVWRSALGERGQLQQSVEYQGSARDSVVAESETGQGGAAAGRVVDLSIARIPLTDTIDGLRSQHVFEVELAVTNASTVPRSLVLMPAALKLQSAEGIRAALRDSMDGGAAEGASGVANGAGSGHGREAFSVAGPEQGIERERETAEAITKDAIAARFSDLNVDPSGSDGTSGSGSGAVGLSDARSAGVVWAGPAPLEVGTVEPCSTITVIARFFPCRAGEHRLPPLALVDTGDAASVPGPGAAAAAQPAEAGAAVTGRVPLQRFDDFEESPRLLIISSQ
jgi:hypothetical protein